MKLKEILDKTTTFFKDKKIESPRLEAELLLSHGLKLERIQLYLRFDQPMKEEELVVLRELVRRRALGEPMAYILGYRDFYKSRFEVSPSVLIPRPETEGIVEEVVVWAKNKKHSETRLGVVDLGCGSGCIGLSVLLELPHAFLLAVDISKEAIEMATKNAQSLGVLDRVRFLHADGANVDFILSNFREFTGQQEVDVLISNPPYIAEGDSQVELNVKKYEPTLALFAKDQGLELLKDWSKKFAPYLSSSGIMLMEMGMSQGLAMQEHFSNLNIFSEVEVLKDLAGHDRIIRGEKNG